MHNIDTVINSLKICTKQIGKCSECQYRSADKPMLICREMATDILEILEKQKEEISNIKLAFLTLPNWNPIVVRCKDCKYAEEHCSYSVFGKTLYVCKHIRQIGREGLAIHIDDWFCADGEAKDG